MFHLFAFSDTITNTANDQVNALTDEVFTIQNNNFLPNDDMYLGAFMALGATINQARLTSPTLRQITPPQIVPVQLSLNPVNDPNYADWLTKPLLVRGGEELQMQATGSSTASTAAVGLGWAFTQLDPIPPYDQYTIYGTSTTAAVSLTWTTVAYTLQDQLPTGEYALISSKVNSTNAIAHRWIIDNMFWRPGMSSDTLITNRQPLWMPPGSLGIMGKFRNTSMPRLQVLVNGTDNAHTIYLRIARIGN